MLLNGAASIWTLLVPGAEGRESSRAAGNHSTWKAPTLLLTTDWLELITRPDQQQGIRKCPKSEELEIINERN